VDDEFITESLKRKRVIDELIEEIRRRKLEFSFSIQYRANTGSDENLLRALKDVGLRTVFIGVESGVESVLKRFDKGISKGDVDKALSIVRDLGFSANIGYMLYNPDTTYNEFKNSVFYLLSTESPTILKLIGMTILKGTPEEKQARSKGLVSCENYEIRYQITDRRIATFANLLRIYYPIYEPVSRDFYELHFMIGDLFSETRMAFLLRIREIEEEIKNLHQQFLSMALDEILTETLKEPAWIDELRIAHKILHQKTQQLLEDGRAFIFHSPKDCCIES